MIVSTSIWVATAYNVEHRSFAAAAWRFLAAFAIVFFTFALEGLETAYIDLRDRDLQQFAGQRAADLFERINEMGDGSQMKGAAFFEAREWAIITLLVAATLMIDKPEYYIPFVAHITNAQPTLQRIVRLALTVALTTFALVWVAQSPGKYVARRNSVNFLSYYSSRFTLLLLQLAWKALSLVGLQHPSKVTDNLALKIMRKCQEKRNLLPSEFRFFADGVKKYGYGFLISDDSLDVQPDGSVKVVSKTLFYVGMPRSGVQRRFEFEEGFEDGTLHRLEVAGPSDLRCWAFEAPQIGEKVTEDDLKTWAGLFYSKDPSTWGAPEYARVKTDTFKLVPSLTGPAGVRSSPPASATEGSDRPLHILDLELSFRQRLPKVALTSNNDSSEGVSRKGDQKALLVLWEIQFSTKANTVPLPKKWGDQTQYPYFKRRSHPALRNNVVIKLPEINGHELIFVDPDDRVNYKVTYDGMTHDQETARFQSQDPSDLLGAPQRPVGSPLSRKSVFYINSPLPAAEYTVQLLIERENPPKQSNPQG